MSDVQRTVLKVHTFIMNALWRVRIGKDSELCCLRHSVKYTGYAHYESEKRLRDRKDQFDASKFFMMGAMIGTGFVGAFMTPFKFPMFAASACGVSVWVYAYAMTEKSHNEHTGAAFQWMKLYDKATTLAMKPSVDDTYTMDQFDTVLAGLKTEKMVLDKKMPKTNNKDYDLSRVKLNETWEEEDWDRWDRVYAD